MPEPVPLDEVYDEATLSLIDAHASRGEVPRSGAGAVPARGEADDLDEAGGDGDDGDDRPRPAGASRIRRGVGGAALAGAMLGLAEVFEPEPDKQAVIEYVPDVVDRHDQAVEFVFVRGAPARSRIIFRPWLLR